MTTALSAAERQQILDLARAAAAAAVRGEAPPPVEAAALPAALRRPAATFVTVRRAGELRGCLGTLEARQPLYADVRQHAAEAVRQDYRFEPVTPAELPELDMEVSVLTEPRPLDYAAPEELLTKLRPGVDGVILAHGPRRATFLPQVWERAPDPAEFLGLLCEKMGLPAETWRRTSLAVSVYQVEVLTAPA